MNQKIENEIFDKVMEDFLGVNPYLPKARKVLQDMRFEVMLNFDMIPHKFDLWAIAMRYGFMLCHACEHEADAPTLEEWE